MAQSKSDLKTMASVAQLLALVLTVGMLYFARDVFIPLSLGLLLSFLLSPIVNRLQRWGISNVMAVVTTAALTFILLAAGLTLLGRELTGLAADLPKRQDELVAKVRSVAGMTMGVNGSVAQLAEKMTEAIEDHSSEDQEAPKKSSAYQAWMLKFMPKPVESKKLPNDGSSVRTPLYVKQVKSDLPLATWASTAGSVLGPLATAGLVSVFALFMLTYRDDLRDRFITVVSRGNYVTTTEAINEAGTRISRYLIAQTIVNASYGLVLAIGLAVIGYTMTDEGVFPNLVLWGVVATVLRFIPYLGPIAAAVFPLAIALSAFPGYGVGVAVLVLIVTMELLSNNVLEPWLYATSTGISAVAVIVAAVFWGWLWGPVGLILSTPLTVCLVVLGRYVPRFKIFSTLLGDDVEIKPSMRFYNRILARDEHRAEELLQQQLDAKDFNAVCDEVMLPAIKQIRSDCEMGQLSESDASELIALSGRLLEKLCNVPDKETSAEQKETDLVSEAASQPLPMIIGCTSHHFSESIILHMLRLSGQLRYQLNSFESDTLPQELIRQISETSPAAVVIVVLPKGGFVQARYLCHSIRNGGYRGPILVPCLGKFKNYDKLFVSFRKAGATTLTTNFSQTQSKLDSFLKRTKPLPHVLETTSMP